VPPGLLPLGSPRDPEPAGDPSSNRSVDTDDLPELVVDVQVVPLHNCRAVADGGLGDGGVDFVRPDDPELDRYKLLLAPSLYLVAEPAAANLARFTEGGGTLAVGFHSGMVDENAHVYLGGYPGSFRDVLGVVTDELFPLLPGERTGLTGDVASGATADLWSNRIRLTGAQAVASHVDGPLAGRPAVTRHLHGNGTAWYLGTHPDQDTLAALIDRIRQEAGVTPDQDAPAGIEVVRRRGAKADYLFLIDHTGKGAEAPAEGVELLNGTPVTGTVTVPPGGVAVVREPR
jgi:beta-galactosidase